MVVSVTVESPLNDEVRAPLNDEVRALIAALNEYLRPLSPTEFQFQVTVDEMAEPDTTVFVARNGLGRAVACGALKAHAGGLGEVKRVFTGPEARGAGVGSEILAAIIARARSAGLTWLMLETGASPGFAAAWALYESNGFTRRGPFLDYPASQWSAYFELDLRGAAADSGSVPAEVGGALGVALLASVFAANGDYVPPQAFTDGLTLALWVGAAALVAAAVAMLWVRRGPGPAVRDQVAEPGEVVAAA